MNVSNLGLPSSSLPSSASSTSAAQVDDATAATSRQGAKGVQAVPAYTPSAELQNLLNLVGQQPDVRHELVQTALGRLQQGVYLTPASAEQTATAMMNGHD